ncbi:flavodoxin [Hypnocyclicus thermotrophus]|uniref:Flavodoxin n=1 Tax=Hypnocyclicus thermotrophus TaxID=1627895 RepID=A0AA46DXL4_9FUSO|nr:flavodoxin domain-containing protein [Hypnocyclicus thermotrophus]TDT67450.1 flavodoxin [Hypnocyclicus thermotrophus]
MGKKGLIVYYSLDGNTEYVVNKLLEKNNFDIIKLSPKKDITEKGLLKYFWGGSQVFMKKMPELNDYNKTINNYNTIIIGTPVWAGNFTPAIRSFLVKEQENLKNKKIYIFACFDGNSGKTFKKFEEFIDKNSIISTLGIKSCIKNKENNNKIIEEWIKQIII